MAMHFNMRWSAPKSLERKETGALAPKNFLVKRKNHLAGDVVVQYRLAVSIGIIHPAKLTPLLIAEKAQPFPMSQIWDIVFAIQNPVFPIAVFGVIFAVEIKMIGRSAQEIPKQSALYW